MKSQAIIHLSSLNIVLSYAICSTLLYIPMFFVSIDRSVAQGLESPKHFYEKGFVVEGDKSKQDQIPSGEASKVPSAENSQSLSEDVSIPEATPDILKVKQIGEGELSFNSKSGVPIRSISVVIAAHDKEHFHKYYEELIEYAEKLKIDFRDVFAIGDSSTLDPSLLYPHDIKPPIIRYFRKLPGPFKDVVFSPTLLMETDSGTILVEGYSSIGDIVNERAEFVRPQETH